jgi:hypothetical protein
MGSEAYPTVEVTHVTAPVTPPLLFEGMISDVSCYRLNIIDNRYSCGYE